MSHPNASGVLGMGIGSSSLRELYYSRGYWRTETLWDTVSAVAQSRSGSLALREGARTITYSDLIASARSFAGGLSRLGLRPGDTVLLHTRNGIDSAIAMLGIIAGGFVCVPVPPMFSAPQVGAIADSAKARALIALAVNSPGEKARTVSGLSPSIEIAIVPDAEASPPSLLPWTAVVNSAPMAEVKISADDPAMVLYSSGSTGAPKGVIHSANTLRYAAEMNARLHRVGSEDRMLIAAEFGFVGGTVLSNLVTILTGAEGIILPRWSPEEALDLIARERVTYTLFVPTHTHDLLQCPELERSDCSSLRRGIFAILTPETWEETRGRGLCKYPFPMYGMSECIGHTTCTEDDPFDAMQHTDGRAFPGTVHEVRDEEGKVLPAGQAGNMFVRGPSRFLGYLNAADLTEGALGTDGFLWTGDRCSIDERGYVKFISRVKELVRRGAMTLIPSEIEAALRRHPDVVDVAVVGVPDKRLGERVCACIIQRPGCALTLDGIKAFLESISFARYSWPEFLVLLEQFPRTPSLKPRRPQLRDIAIARLGDAIKS